MSNALHHGKTVNLDHCPVTPVRPSIPVSDQSTKLLQNVESNETGSRTGIVLTLVYALAFALPAFAQQPVSTSETDDLSTPIEIGPRDEVGKETLGRKAARKAVSGLLGRVLGGGDRRGSAQEGPRTRRDPTRRDDYLRIEKPETGINVGARARWTDDGLVASTRISDHDEKGTYHSVYLQSCDGRRLYPRRLEVYDLWAEHSLSVSWSRTRYSGGQVISRESGGWSDSWTEHLASHEVDQSALPAIWQMHGYSRAHSGIQQLGAYFNLDPEQLAEMGDLALIAHVTRPEQDPVTTEPFDWLIVSGPEDPLLIDPDTSSRDADIDLTRRQQWQQECVQSTRPATALTGTEQPGTQIERRHDDPCDCTELEQLAAAAQAEVDETKEEAQQLETQLETAQERLKEARDVYADLRDRQEDLSRYFDESSWIAGDQGRITRGDLEILRDARGEILDQWKVGESTAEEVVEQWKDIRSDSFERLQREKREELDETNAQLEDARENIEAAERDYQDIQERLDEARQRLQALQEKARRASELYEDCLAECIETRRELRQLIDEKVAEIGKLDDDCPASDSEAIEQEIRNLEDEGRELAEEIPKTVRRLGEALRNMAEIFQVYDIGQEIPEEGYTGLWDWGEDLGRLLGRAADREDELGMAGKIVSTTAGVILEDLAGFPVGTDIVSKGVPVGYKIMLEKLHPESPGFMRCLLRAQQEGVLEGKEPIDIRDHATRAWRAVRNGSADENLQRLGEEVERYSAQVDSIRSTRDEIRQLESEGFPPIPEPPPEGVPLDEVRGHEHTLRMHRDRLRSRCMHLRDLREQLKRQIAEARETLRKIREMQNRLDGYAQAIQDYFEIHRHTAFNCA